MVFSGKQLSEQYRKMYHPDIRLLVLVLHEAAGTGGGYAVGLTGQSAIGYFSKNFS